MIRAPRTTMFFQVDLYPVSAHSSGSRMSTMMNPRSKWSFTSETLIFCAFALHWRALPRDAALVAVVLRESARGATAARMAMEEAAQAAIVVVCGWGGRG